jgi:hypothetical protein
MEERTAIGIAKAYSFIWMLTAIWVLTLTWSMVEFALAGWSAGPPDPQGAVVVGLSGMCVAAVLIAAAVLAWRMRRRWCQVIPGALLATLGIIIMDYDDFLSLHFQQRTLIGIPVLLMGIAAIYLFGFNNDIKRTFVPQEKKVSRHG